MTEMNRTDADTALAQLTELSAVLATAENRDEAFAALSEAADHLIGHRLFTIMAFDEDAIEVERLYTSNPDAYPTGGRKKKKDTAWGRQVLEQGKPYIGHTANDIRTHFNDHELIIGLGLESVLNMPIRLAGRTLGTMNLLHGLNHYDEADLPAARMLSSLIAGLLEFPTRASGS